MENTTQEICEQLKRYRNAPAIGRYVKRAIDRLEELERNVTDLARQIEADSRTITDLEDRDPLNDLKTDLHQTNRAKGFGMTPNPGAFEILAHLQLTVGELSEAAEDVRNWRMTTTFEGDDQKPVGFSTELADAVIRIFNMASDMGIDIGEQIRLKNAYNATRPFRHGGKWA